MVGVRDDSRGELRRLAHTPDHALGDLDGLARGLSGQEERELVAADAERFAVLP